MVVVRPSGHQDPYVTLMDLGAPAFAGPTGGASRPWWASGGSIYNVAQGTIPGSLVEPLLGNLGAGGNITMGTLTGTWTNIRQDYLPRLLNKEDLHHLQILTSPTAAVTGPVNITSAPGTSILPQVHGLTAPHEINFWTMICLHDRCEQTYDEFFENFQGIYMMVVTHNPSGTNPPATLQPARVSTLDSDGEPIPARNPGLANQTNFVPEFVVRPVVQVHKQYIACRTIPLPPDCPEDCPMGTEYPGPPGVHCPPECLVKPPVDVPTNEVLFPLVLIGVLAVAGISLKFISKKSVFDRI
jgi:hypothetical protein